MNNTRYRLQRKATYYMPNVLGGHSQPVVTYCWKDIAVSDDKEALEAIRPDGRNYRIVDSRRGAET